VCKSILALGVAILTLAFSIEAYAQGVGISGLLAADQRLRFRNYVISQGQPSADRYKLPVIVNVILPATVPLYEVPAEFGLTDYRYAVVNDRTVLVEPRTRAVVQIVD
jgi:hypothetical protein